MSQYEPKWRRWLRRVCPWLFWYCPGQNYHWRWNRRICYCRVGTWCQVSARTVTVTWRGGVWVDGKELVPVEERSAWAKEALRLRENQKEQQPAETPA